MYNTGAYSCGLFYKCGSPPFGIRDRRVIVNIINLGESGRAIYYVDACPDIVILYVTYAAIVE